MSSSIKKCEHCGQWTDGEKAFCTHCGQLLNEKYLKDKADFQEHMKKQYRIMKSVKLKGSDNNILIRIVEKMIQGGQLILGIILALITFILISMPG